MLEDILGCVGARFVGFGTPKRGREWIGVFLKVFKINELKILAVQNTIQKSNKRKEHKVKK